MSCSSRRRVVSGTSTALLCFILMMLGGGGGIVDGLQQPAVEEISLDQQAVGIGGLQTQVIALQREVNKLKARAAKAVSFTVYSSKPTMTAINQGIFVFDMVVSNIANGYDALTGVFTAPYSGTYLFVLNIMVDNNNKYIQVAIDKSGTLLALTHADSINDPWDKGMCHVTAHLNSGDRVYVRHNAGLPELFGERWSSFSGILVHAD
ncbi:C1q-related factor-like [Pomacea canaliculata]|uniref:C1q-related factor-like n=1 Tax=Pomacea canaliculata TaxID=400727 RepID=UPI000D72BA09|nr:C1q-related factor-like [Pomacea canaliculata]XP_025113080.1 C1q-related factor-like [Pomacea canaliculata]